MLGAANASTLLSDCFNYLPALELEVNAAIAIADDTVTPSLTCTTAHYTLSYNILTPENV